MNGRRRRVRLYPCNYSPAASCCAGWRGREAAANDLTMSVTELGLRRCASNHLHYLLYDILMAPCRDA
jgi:hypothetical protein